MHPAFVSSLLGVNSKKEKGSFRVFHDLSFTKGWAINDFIPLELTVVCYEDFDFVSDLVFCHQGLGLS